MPISPKNLPDGRHWCDPASADPEESPVTCPDCGTVWVFDGFQTWAQPQDVLDLQNFFDEPLVIEESPGD